MQQIQWKSLDSNHFAASHNLVFLPALQFHFIHMALFSPLILFLSKCNMCYSGLVRQLYAPVLSSELAKGEDVQLRLCTY